MSVQQYLRDLESLRKKHVDAEKKVAKYRTIESKKRSEADKAEADAFRTSRSNTRKSRLAQKERRLRDAQRAAEEACKWESKVADYSKKENDLQKKLMREQAKEASNAEKKRNQVHKREIRRLQAAQRNVQSRLTDTETDIQSVMRTFPSAKQEKLRILVLTANPCGNLRTEREQKRISEAVRKATHRDWIEIKYLPAATVEDLFDGLSQFLPHVLHFSGHSDDFSILLEEDKDSSNNGLLVTADALKRALVAVDNPPAVVVLNSCKSAGQLAAIVGDEIPFAIGMLDSVEDENAINFAARFYASIANGQSLGSSVSTAQAYLRMKGFQDSELPFLEHAIDADSKSLFLVQAPKAG